MGAATMLLMLIAGRSLQKVMKSVANATHAAVMLVPTVVLKMEQEVEKQLAALTNQEDPDSVEKAHDQAENESHRDNLRDEQWLQKVRLTSWHFSAVTTIFIAHHNFVSHAAVTSCHPCHV